MHSTHHHSRRTARPLLTLALTALPALALSPAAHATELADGIDVGASYTGESAWNVHGGQDTGGAYAGQFYAGADFDLDKLTGWQGATVHLKLSSRHGDNLSVDELGNTTSVQEIYGGQGQRLANLTLEQHFLGDRLIVEAGRTVANIHFLGSQLCNYFQLNAACGNPTFVFHTSSFTWWPVSSWGGHALAWLTPTIYAHVGAYEVNPKQAQDGEHGLSWSTHDATGVVTPFAVGYKTTAASARLPTMFEVGGWYDASDYQDPLLDANRTPAALSGNDYATRSGGRSGWFVRFEQQLTRPDASGDRGLTVFGNVLGPGRGALQEDWFFDVGFVQKGTFASRPHDTVGFVYTQQRYSDEALENLRLSRAASGGSGTPHASQPMMELSYGIQVTPALRVQPNVIYDIHPDQFGDPSRTRNLPNAWVVGLRVDLQLTDALAAGVREAIGAGR
ncbi:carbohydrate porin [Solimonas marina]|uniref:Carbohydrate porin n=1 Tax=Solimonas marina TaxID=2714601 RepID=A0A969W8V1_9GAMM|nr:carbohydrate porin [Solimonas marina]NKF22123.1 carbohydrate porin [Solimonas marina]